MAARPSLGIQIILGPLAPMLNSSFSETICGKFCKGSEKTEMLSCRKCHPLSPLLEVFFDLKYRNRVPKSLKTTVFSIMPTAKFWCSGGNFVGYMHATALYKALPERSCFTLSFVFALLFGYMEGTGVPKASNIWLYVNRELESRHDQMFLRQTARKQLI